LAGLVGLLLGAGGVGLGLVLGHLALGRRLVLLGAAFGLETLVAGDSPASSLALPLTSSTTPCKPAFASSSAISVLSALCSPTVDETIQPSPTAADLNAQPGGSSVTAIGFGPG